LREQLKLRRKQLRLTQEDVAKLSGLTRSHYSHIETGRREPNFAQMEAIAKALKVKTELKFFKQNCDKTYQNLKGVV
jgi:putative transcriptional regulator